MLCCEIDGIFDTLVSSEELLSHFFSILEQQRPLVSSRAGYFARVLSSLLAKCSSPVMQFVQGNTTGIGACRAAVRICLVTQLHGYQQLDTPDCPDRAHAGIAS